MTLTFHLREGLVFSDGVPLTAAHFVYGAERLCSPELDSNSATLLFDVIGCEEFFTSAGDAGSCRGGESRARGARPGRANPGGPVRAARAVLPGAGLNWSAIPVRQELVEAGGAAWWTNPATRIGNGPFRLVSLRRRTTACSMRATTPIGGDRPKLEGIEWLFYVPGDDAIAAYRDGQVDAAWVRDSDFPRSRRTRS